MVLRVLSYNIQDGGRLRLPLIANVIRRQQPDVVALLEATNRWAVAGLARGLGMRLIFGPANNPFHVAWLSKLPVERSANHRLPGLAKTLLEIEVGWNGQRLQLFATHLAAGSDRIHPAEEAPQIVERIRSVATGPHLLVGDFNALHPDDQVGTPPPSFTGMHDAIDNDPRQAIRELLAAGYLDCFRTAHADLPGYTYPAATAWLRLDYIFATSEMATSLSTCDVIDGALVRRASDHLPLLATFRE
jgi:endonuclease/exonuclease/phosphatase family metal-dependent hydrolase